jgi:hypothetical protein
VGLGLLAQVGQEELAAVDHPMEVHTEHPVEIFEGHLLEAAPGSHTSIVHQDLHTTVGLHDLVRQRLHPVAVAHVGHVRGNNQAIARTRTSSFVQAPLIDVDQRQMATQRGELLGQCTPDAAPSTGYCRDSSL